MLAKNRARTEAGLPLFAIEKKSPPQTRKHQSISFDQVIFMTNNIVMKKDNEESANVWEVKEHFSAYLAKAEKGRKTVICRRNRPVAELVPVKEGPAENKTRLGSDPGSIKVKGDLTEPAISSKDWGVLK